MKSVTGELDRDRTVGVDGFKLWMDDSDPVRDSTVGVVGLEFGTDAGDTA